MTEHRRPRLAPFGLGLISGALVAGGFACGVFLANLHNGLIATTFTAVGVFVLDRRPGHREGWLFLATGVAHAVMFFGRQYAIGSVGADEPSAVWLGWLGAWPLALVLALSGVTLLCFPDGRLPSPRWRVVVAAMVPAAALLSLTSAVWPVEYADNGLAIAHPFRVVGYEMAQRVWNVLGPAAYLLFQLVWVIGAVVRLRRACGDEARQLRWFAYAVVMGAVAMGVGLVVFRTPALGVLAVPLVAIAAAVAIVKYRLYDIDLLINKTVVYGALAVIVTTVYVVVVVGIGRLIGVADAGGPWLPLAATAVVAVVFERVRRRVQTAADRLVYGRRPTPYESLARLSTHVSHGGHDADLFTGLASTIADGVGAAEVTLWVGAEAELVAVATWPPTAAPGTPVVPAPTSLAALADGGRTHVRPIDCRGAVRGAVALTKARGEVLTVAEDRLLQDLVAQAELVLDNIGLGEELRRRLHQISVQAVELQAAAKRIVAAQDEARRCLERDLHDGAQQRLVVLTLTLQAIATRAAPDVALAGTIEDARRQLNLALAELRELARGIHPAVLTQEGLGAALGSLAERSPIPVTVDVPLGTRLPREVEAAAYFIVSEALTNATKHSGATAIVVTGQIADNRLSVEVADDGRGGADGRWGNGLQGILDRLATLNGRLTVHSPADSGTRLRAEIPCAW
ncbi:sensor histidine kinase [Streptomyces sp. NPDC001315]|uniref:sensor histidine kinase n=1 Tax=Streptomyces sp. NPDC001315 TaxID=3364562 RepID=UPI00369460B1